MNSPEKIVQEALARAAHPHINLADIGAGKVHSPIANMLNSLRMLMTLYMSTLKTLSEEDVIATFKSIVDVSNGHGDKNKAIAEQCLFAITRAGASDSTQGAVVAIYDKTGENEVTISLGMVGNHEVIRESLGDLVQQIKGMGK
jgi:hypothetical protein